MSEPIQKGEIDLKSLDQALNDGEAASEVPAETLQKNSDTLAQPPAEARSSEGNSSSKAEHAQKASSPATLSPSSPRAMSPAPTSTQPPTSDLPPAVAELKSMFPDLDNETIAAVLSSRGGDQESAVNALLQMSDPNFKPATPETRTDSDALLAQTIAMEEEQRQHEQMVRHQQRLQQQQQHSQSMGRGGGGAGSFFSGLLNSDSREQSMPSAPSYDPNALTYQPRVRKTPAPTAGARNLYVPQNQQPAASPSYADGESIVPGMPGAKEAKQWQEEINRMAETGLARAASTFSSFRQKASAALNNAQQAGDGQGQTGSSANSGSGAGAGFAQAFQNFRNSTGRGSNAGDEKAQVSANSPSRHGLTSPRTPNASEYDQDPSPVSENELAKIISRGAGSSASGAESEKTTSGNARAMADRYGLGIRNAGRSNSGSTQSGAATGSSDHVGWDQAGRTPISIKDNTTSANTQSSANEAGKKSLDSIAKMDSASGRGITSPRLDRSPTKETSSTNSTGVAAAAATGAAGGVGATALAKNHDDDPNDDSDDLEYVSNPFEDED